MNISFAGIFLEGLLSFLSPCVLPLLPLFMAYLSGEGKKDDEGNIIYDQRKTFLSTIFFVLGISFVFVLLGLSVGFISDFLKDYQDIVALIGGVLIIILGLHETGLISISLLDHEYSFKDKFSFAKMTYFKAFCFGFLFSFAWTPCIGPLLASVLLLSVSEGSLVYLLFYALGLIIPFVLTGLFTSGILNFIQKRKKIFKYIMVIAGVIMISYGISNIYNASRNIMAYKNAETVDVQMISDKTFTDANGKEILFKDYRGKYVFLNFTATWCSYCEMERADYLAFAKENDIHCFYVMSPLSENGLSDEDVRKHIDDKGIDIPVIVDKDGTLLYQGNVSGYPTLMVIAPDGRILGYIAGYINKEGMENVYQQAIALYEGQ